MGSFIQHDKYDGREQARIKHILLEKYLEKLFFIVGNNGNKNTVIELNYVDCFAGPWLDESQTLDTSSIAISLSVLNKVKNTLIQAGYSIKMRALFVEKDKRSIEKGEQYLSNRKSDSIDAKYIHGDFAENIDNILKWCGNGFTFFFIDPKGYKSISLDIIQPLLERKRSEFLINFMYEFINRNASMESQKINILELMGENIDLEYLDAEEREYEILKTYRKNIKLRAKHKDSWVAYSRVIHPDKNRTKYHLIYFTTHPKGIIEFSEIAETVEKTQQKTRAEKHEAKLAQKNAMDDLFGGSGSEYVRTENNNDEIDSYWLMILKTESRKFDARAFANILEHTDWSPKLLQESLGRLIKAGRIENVDDINKQRRSRFLHYEKCERLKLCT
jgi:three-Cys-motif partner protein